MRKTVYYTFGNHMHWVDMEWLWGYEVLPGSVRDMLRIVNESGARGNVNFDGVGYERMAASAPHALADLRAAVVEGRVEVVGASYGQPYGLFQGGESNVRQRIFGVRAAMRLLGVRPRAFWEEEFDFHDQLPQILKGCGFTAGSLFFQWTWHTPHIPHEKVPVVRWQGIDGSLLAVAARTDLCLHQWPEDFTGLLSNPELRSQSKPAIVQWLELMPSKDWMCRAELILPRLQELLAQPGLDVKCVTLSELVRACEDDRAPIRRYTMDDVFHGMSLGKNGDFMRRLSRNAEARLLAAESVSAVAGMFGRPYASWDVYPTWELEEAWRELLAAQHHDNDECEALCGFVGERSYERSLGLSGHVLDRTIAHLANRADVPAGHRLVFNSLGFARDIVVTDRDAGRVLRLKHVPAFGYATVDPEHAAAIPYGVAAAITSEDEIALVRDDLRVAVDRRRGVISQLSSYEFAGGLLDGEHPLLDLAMVRGGATDTFSEADVRVEHDCGRPIVVIERRGRDGARVTMRVACADIHEAIDVEIAADQLPRPDGRMHAGLTATVSPALKPLELLHDTPYAIGPVQATHERVRKYPTGDWMTSPQVFETVSGAFTGLSLVDMHQGGRGLLLLHDGSQSFFREGDRIRQLLTMHDPWDGDFFRDSLRVRLRLVPHGRMSHAERWKLAQEFNAPVLSAVSRRDGGDIPAAFGPFHDDAPGAIATAFYRESEHAGEGLDRWAGRGMGHPYVLRIVELNGRHASATMIFPGPIARAVRTNLMGEAELDLPVKAASVVHGPHGLPWSSITMDLEPHAIATVMLDLEIGRKVTRDLDAHRSVWATVHRTVHS